MAEIPKNPYGATDLTYNDYLKVPELLKLQHPLSRPVHHDEMLFIVIHQAYELWFKLIMHELEQAKTEMEAGEVLQANHFVDRTVQIFHVLVQQIHILETMRPADFLKFREKLMPASGFQSIQFRELEFFLGLKDERYLRYFDKRPDLRVSLESRLKAPGLKDAWYALLARRGYPIPENPVQAETTPEGHAEIIQALRKVYEQPKRDLELYLLCESLISLDQHLVMWREHHVHVVERVIGFKPGTGGSTGAQYLRATTSKKAFPTLWDVRGFLENV
jgi:tryptophan 2,3-dioxygenase